jgi:monofunctional glycosyltransferase
MAANPHPMRSGWARLIGWLLALLLLLTLIPVAAYRVVPVPYTPLMLIRAWQGIPAKERHWLPLAAMGPAPLAVLSTEDQRFFSHWGLDTRAIRNAIDYNQDHERTHGASTITQQTAKNVFLWPGRDWLRKGLELWFSLWLELLWPKARILEVYLNVIEFGPGVYGIHAASRHWFGKTPAQLSQEEAASLAVILPHPLAANPLKLSRPLRARRDWALHQMRRIGDPAGS